METPQKTLFAQRTAEAIEKIKAGREDVLIQHVEALNKDNPRKTPVKMTVIIK